MKLKNIIFHENDHDFDRGGKHFLNIFDFVICRNGGLGRHLGFCDESKILQSHFLLEIYFFGAQKIDFFGKKITKIVFGHYLLYNLFEMCRKQTKANNGHSNKATHIFM